MSTQNKLGTMNMTKLVIDMSLPLMFSLLIQSLYNIVDSIFVARLGENALTATSLAFPIQLLMIAVSVGTSVGINSLLSKTVGAKEYEKTGMVATTGVILALIGMLVFMVAGLVFARNFVMMFTDDILIYDDCYHYLFICMIFCGGTFLGTMYQRFLQSVGFSFESMLSLCAGAICNLVLDPIMIFGYFGLPAMGVSGAAIATIIGQWVCAFVAIWLNNKKNKYVKLQIRNYHFDPNIVIAIYKVGLPTIVTQALGSLMVSSINGILISYSSTAVAFFGIYFKLQNFLFMPMNGLGQAEIPIIGYNFGAKKYDRIKDTFKCSIPIAVVIALISTVVFMLCPTFLLSLFNANENMMNIGIPALRIISVTFVFAAVTIVLGYGMSGVGNGMVNMISTFIRQLLIPVIFVYFIAKYFGVNYVWYAFWVSEVLGFIYAIYASRKTLKKINII